MVLAIEKLSSQQGEFVETNCVWLKKGVIGALRKFGVGCICEAMHQHGYLANTPIFASKAIPKRVRIAL
jgi:hypothetical protein